MISDIDSAHIIYFLPEKIMSPNLQILVFVGASDDGAATDQNSRYHDLMLQTLHPNNIGALLADC